MIRLTRTFHRHSDAPRYSYAVERDRNYLFALKINDRAAEPDLDRETAARRLSELGVKRSEVLVERAGEFGEVVIHEHSGEP